NCFEPRDANDRLLWMIEVGIAPEWWGGNSDSRYEPLIFGASDLSGSQLESIDPDSVNRPLIVLTLSRSHKEPTGRHKNKFGEVRSTGLISNSWLCHHASKQPSTPTAQRDGFQRTC